MLKRFNDPNDWYWKRGTEIHGSRGGHAVQPEDADYKAWLAAGNTPTELESRADLDGVRARVAASKLEAIDAKKIRALTDVRLTGDATRLEALEAEAEAVRTSSRGDAA